MNRARAHYGNSIFCYPWTDESRGPERFAEHEEDLRHIVIDRQNLREARVGYTFLKDRWDSYDLPCQGHP